VDLRSGSPSEDLATDRRPKDSLAESWIPQLQQKRELRKSPMQRKKPDKPKKGIWSFPFNQAVSEVTLSMRDHHSVQIPRIVQVAPRRLCLRTSVSSEGLELVEHQLGARDGGLRRAIVNPPSISARGHESRFAKRA
jgi:hypothetical protein